MVDSHSIMPMILHYCRYHRVRKLTNFLIVNRLSDTKFRLLGFVLAGFLSSIWTKSRYATKLRDVVEFEGVI